MSCFSMYNVQCNNLCNSADQVVIQFANKDLFNSIKKTYTGLKTSTVYIFDTVVNMDITKTLDGVTRAIIHG